MEPACFADVRAYIKAKLGITADTPDAERRRLVNASIHKRDYYISPHTIRNWRTQSVDKLWKRHPQDSMSTEAAVRYPAQSRRLGLCQGANIC